MRKNPNASTALAICADIANGFKHLNLHSPRIPGGPAEVVRQDAGMTIPFRLGEAHFTYHFDIEADGKTYTERIISDDAIADWDAWLTGHSFELPN